MRSPYRTQAQAVIAGTIIGTLLLGIALLFRPSGPHTASTMPVQIFKDIPLTHSLAVPAEDAKKRGFITGYGDGTFRPQNPITRGEFVTMIMRTMVTPEDLERCPSFTSCPFADVPEDWDVWYGNALCFAWRLSFVNGDPDGSFRPARYLTLAESAKILALAYRVPLEAGAATGPEDEWYAPALEGLRKRGAMPLDLSEPAKYLTRGDLVRILYALMNPSKPAAPAQPDPAQKSTNLDAIQQSILQNLLRGQEPEKLIEPTQYPRPTRGLRSSASSSF